MKSKYEKLKWTHEKLSNFLVVALRSMCVLKTSKRFIRSNKSVNKTAISGCKHILWYDKQCSKISRGQNQKETMP